MMNESVLADKPFFIQLWFHAPHGPWETLSDMNYLYDKKQMNKNEKLLPLCNENIAATRCVDNRNTNAMIRQRDGRLIDKYKTMVSAMDRSIGNVLNSLRIMGIEENTLVVFTSDNGPEFVTGGMYGGQKAGSAGTLRGSKRDIYEGGIRVPTIFQWIGTIPRGRNISTFGISTDLFPTFIEAASISLPSTVKLDGISLLSLLTMGGKHRKSLKR